MSVELIGIVSVGVAAVTLNLSTAMFLMTWLRHIDRRLATLECMLLAKGVLGEATR